QRGRDDPRDGGAARGRQGHPENAVTAAGRLGGRVAIVTGAAQGIGQGIVAMLLGEGASVLAFDLDEALLKQAAASWEGRVETFVGSVTEGNSVAAAVTAAEERLGPVDILVNNAGIWVIKPLLEQT